MTYITNKRKSLLKSLQKERKRSIRQSKNRQATKRSQSQKGHWSTFDSYKGQESSMSDQLSANDFAKKFQKLSFDYIEKVFPVPTSGYREYVDHYKKNPENFFELELPLRAGCKIEHLDTSL